MLKLTIAGYQTFKDVCAVVGPVRQVFYVQSGGQVSKLLALMQDGMHCIETGIIRTTVTQVTALLIDFPTAIEAPFDIQGNI